jgi:glycosyltransferase involved in cell wall biosynthesis
MYDTHVFLMNTSPIPRVRIYHNYLWARYIGAIFSKIQSNSSRSGLAVSFVQVAETDTQQSMLGKVDLSYHQYPYRLLFPGRYSDVPLYRLITALMADVFRNPCELVVLPGYHRVEYWAMLMVCIVLRRKRAVFCDSTAYDQAKKYRWKEIAKAFFFRHCDGIFCYGTRSKEYIESYGVIAERTYHPCQAAALPHRYDASAILGYYEKNRVEAATITKFLYIGRLAVEKGLHDLLDAFRYVHEQLPGTKLNIVGSGFLDGELRERTRRLGVESAVAFLGSKGPEEMGQLLMTSTALILPSHFEPWGLVVNEALSNGCPVVASNICGCSPELVRDGVTGYSFPAGDVRALGGAMIAVVRMSVDRFAVAKKCLDLVGQYTPERAASEILDGCASILAAP